MTRALEQREEGEATIEPKVFARVAANAVCRKERGVSVEQGVFRETPILRTE
jgi:hypothetical protein